MNRILKACCAAAPLCRSPALRAPRATACRFGTSRPRGAPQTVAVDPARARPATPRVGVACTVFRRADGSRHGDAGAVDLSRVLLVRRGSAPAQGLWSLPGGSVDLGEPHTAAAARELLEECGIFVDVAADGAFATTDAIFETHAHGEVLYHYTLTHVLGTVTATAAEEASPGDDALEASWVPVDALQKYADRGELVRGTQPVVRRAMRMLNAGLACGNESWRSGTEAA